MFYMFAINVKVCHFFFLYFKHLHSSQSRWRVVSWSCGWRKSSICPGSCAGRTGWSSSTGWVRTSPLPPGWRENEAGWWGTRGRSGLIAQAGSGSGASKWIRTDWTWGRGCGYPRSMAVEDGEREMILAVEHLFLRDRSWFVYSGAKEAVFPVLYFHDIFWPSVPLCSATIGHVAAGSLRWWPGCPF